MPLGLCGGGFDGGVRGTRDGALDPERCSGLVCGIPLGHGARGGGRAVGVAWEIYVVGVAVFEGVVIPLFCRVPQGQVGGSSHRRHAPGARRRGAVTKRWVLTLVLAACENAPETVKFVCLKSSWCVEMQPRGFQKE